MATTTTETALEVSEQQTNEIAVSTQQAMAAKEIEGAIIIANKFPRNEDRAFGKVMRSCERFSFAKLTSYSYPRGKKQITGPSVNLAREIARCWGNIRYGADVIHDDETTRTIRCWAWDLETNTRESQDVSFKKLIYRQKGGWQTPDERDLRELSNRQAAIATRNCILHLVPPDLREDAVVAAKMTIQADVAKDPEEARKKLILAFQSIGVRVEDLEKYLGHPIRQIVPEEVADLRGIWKSISDGNSIWAEYVKSEPEKPEAEGAVTMDDLTGKTPKPEPVPSTPEVEPAPEEPKPNIDDLAKAITAVYAADSEKAVDIVVGKAKIAWTLDPPEIVELDEAAAKRKAVLRGDDA